MQKIKTRDKSGNKVNEIVFETTQRDPEERRSFPLRTWRETALDRVVLPDGTSVAVDLPLHVLQDRNQPARLDGRDFEALKSGPLAAAQTLKTECPTCSGLGYTGDADIGDVDLCPLCDGTGEILSHFGGAVLRFLAWVQSPDRKHDEKSIERLNKENSIKREFKARKQAALNKIPGAGNLDGLKLYAARKAEHDVFVKASEAARKIDEELAAALKAIDEEE